MYPAPLNRGWIASFHLAREASVNGTKWKQARVRGSDNLYETLGERARATVDERGKMNNVPVLR